MKFCDNLQEILEKSFSFYKKRLCLGERKVLPNGEIDKKYTWVTYEDVHENMLRIYSALSKKLSIPPKSLMSICSKDSIKWVIADLSIIYSGCVAGNIHSELPRDSIVKIMNTAETVCVFCDKERTQTFLDIISSKECPKFKYLILLDDDSLPEGSYDPNVVYKLSDIKKMGEECLETKPIYSEQNDVASVIFTSGSTGQPKGVSTTHTNFVKAIRINRKYDPYVCCACCK